jgi:glycosyltransferase involved in cell wall biosynthesis
MKIAVVSAVYNEEKHIGRLIENLLKQTLPPAEIVFTDDGSTDATAKIIGEYQKDHSVIRLILNSNQGPAASRNKAWKNTSSDIVIFTDGDCIPDPQWIQTLVCYFTSEEVGAVAGTYRTVNSENILARFVGLEIAWRYRNVRGEVDAHGAYNLAIRRTVLCEMGGFDESYKAPSGEDWDLTYRISRKHKILFAPDAVVAHEHPESFFRYMGTQVRRGYDRIKLYNDHPERRGGDVYTGQIVKYQVLAVGLLILSVFLMPFAGFRVIPLAVFFFLFLSCWNSFPYIYRRSRSAAFYGLMVQFCRCFAWALGAMKGFLAFGFSLKNQRGKE